MSGRADEQIDVAVARILAERPADVLEILDLLRTVRPRLLAQQEGAIHGFLHARLRRGTIKISGRSPAGLPRYASIESEAGPTSGAWVPLAEVAPKQSQAALRIAKGLRDEADRGRVVADVLAHMQALAAADTPRAFGPARRARQLLDRGDRGRAAVFFTDGAGDGFRRVVLHEGPWIVAAIALFFIVKIFVAEVYVIPSESMRPTLEVGDRVVAYKIGSAAERWDVVVFRNNGKTIVKRLVGLGGEQIALWQGDIYLDGELAVKPAWARTALRSAYKAWTFEQGGHPGWDRTTTDDHVWWAYMDTSSLIGEFDLGDRIIRRPVALFDAYVRLTGRRTAGSGLALRLSRGLLANPKDVGAVEWILTVDANGIRLTDDRRGAERRERYRAEALPAGEVTLELGYVDGWIRARITGSDGITRHFDEASEAAYLPVDLSVATTGTGSEIQRVGLDRDLHYANLLILGVPTQADIQSGEQNPHLIPEGHLFFLGDNSRDSKDSRHREVGDISADEVVGPVRLRIWPPGRLGSVK